jgi:hypothetical protein
MFRIVEKALDLQFPRGHHQHVMLCQIPIELGNGGSACRLANPAGQWQEVRSVLELVAQGEGNLKKLHFLIFPESAVPAAHVEEAIELIGHRFRTNTVTMFGVEHTSLSAYRSILERYREDNAEVLASVLEDLDSGDIDRSPVNSAVVAVKEANGRLRIFLMAKSHPFVGEETIDPFQDLYRGKVFPFFRCAPNGFNFMALICLDYVYRDLYQSNISVIIDKANDLFFQTRQRLDLLAVLECNPKPEHKAFRDVLNGFYGEYLAYTPGVRDTVTLFCNSSEETSGIASHGEATFGRSSVIIHNSHKIAPVDLPEFSSDDFGGLPVCRLRFGTATRLYYFNLPLFHELDPRTTRVPLKIHSIFRPVAEKRWQRLEGETEKDYVPDRA